jgi:hypothetical protein
LTCISRAYGLVPCDTAVRSSSAAACSGQKRLSPTRQYTPGACAAEQASRSVPTTSACWAKPTRSKEHRRLCQNAAKPALVTAMITVPEACTRDCSAGLKQSMREHTVPVPASGRVEPSRPTSSCMGRTAAMKLLGVARAHQPRSSARRGARLGGPFLGAGDRRAMGRIILGDTTVGRPGWLAASSAYRPKR